LAITKVCSKAILYYAIKAPQQKKPTVLGENEFHLSCLFPGEENWILVVETGCAVILRAGNDAS
jgi:hypothetical protein